MTPQEQTLRNLKWSVVLLCIALAGQIAAIVITVVRHHS